MRRKENPEKMSLFKWRADKKAISDRGQVIDYIGRMTVDNSVMVGVGASGVP